MMRPSRTICAVLLGTVLLPFTALRAQQLTPDAYAPNPVGVNLALASDNYSRGDVAVDPSLPVEGLHATINAFSVGYGRTLGFLGHYTNIGFYVPYVHADLTGVYLGQDQQVHRDGIADPQVRGPSTCTALRP